MVAVPQVVVPPPGLRFFRSYGWHNYPWSTYYQPADSAGQLWTSLAAVADSTPNNAIKVNFQIKQAGTVTIQWGTRTGAYTGRSPAIPIAANTAGSYRITGLPRKTNYFINAIASASWPATVAGGQPNVVSNQGTEVQYATT
jgi:hypothetical protein